MIESLLLILLGVALVAGLLLVLRSDRLRERLSRGNASLRALARLRPVAPEVFDRQFEAGIYVGMCLGVLIGLVGVLTAVT